MCAPVWGAFSVDRVVIGLVCGRPGGLVARGCLSGWPSGRVGGAGCIGRLVGGPIGGLVVGWFVVAGWSGSLGFVLGR